MRFLLFLLRQTFLHLAFSVTFCERPNWRPFWYNTALSKWESPHFFARFKFRKLHTNVFLKSAAILPRNGQFVLMTSTNDRIVNQSISRWCYYTPRSIPMTIFSPCEILSYRRVNTLCNFPSIFEPALKIVLKVANEFQKQTALKIALKYIKSKRCIALKNIVTNRLM